MNTKEWIRALKFALFSTGAGIIQVASFTILNEWAKTGYWFSYLVALVLSVLFNFTVNRKFTFKAANNVPIAMLKVGLFYLVFTPVSTWAGNYFEGKGTNEYIVLGVTMLCNLVLEFLYTKYIVYHNAIDSAVKEKSE